MSMSVPHAAPRDSADPVRRPRRAAPDHPARPQTISHGQHSFERLIADLLARFADLSDDVVEGAIAGAMQRLGESLDVDRITLSEADAETFRVLHSWAATGVEPVPQTFAASQVPWYVRQLRRGETVALARVEDLPPEAAHERDVMRRMGTRSHLAIPLSIGHGVVGALTLGAVRRHHEWPEHLVQRPLLLG